MNKIINDIQSFCFDEFKQGVDLCSDLEVVQLDSGQDYYSTQQILLEDIYISRSFFSRKMETKGAFPKEDFWIFHFQSSGVPLFINGKFLDENEIAIHKPYSTFSSVCNNNHLSCAIGIREELLEKLGEKYKIRNLLKKVKNKDSIIVEPHLMEKLKLIIGALFNDMKINYTLYKNSSHNQYIKAETFTVASFLMEIITSSSLVSKKRKENPVLSKSLKFIHENKYKAITIEEVCQDTQFTQRTIYYHFNKIYSLSTKQYIQYLKLNLIRNELLNRKEKINISEVAGKYGFWHMGQFSKDYKKLFGELPSKTSKG